MARHGRGRPSAAWRSEYTTVRPPSRGLTQTVAPIRGDVCITLHAIPHSGSRNEGDEARQNMIFRLRAKKRQPNRQTNGATDHPDRDSFAGTGASQMGRAGEPDDDPWYEFEQDERPYFPGEQGNEPWERSKFALCNIWHEWDGMADVVAEERAKAEASGVYPLGAGPAARAAYEAAATDLSRLYPTHSPAPTTPGAAVEYYKARAPSTLRFYESEPQQAKL